MAYKVATTTEPNFLLDTVEINKKYSAYKDDPRRYQSGTFRAPKGCNTGQLANIGRERGYRYIDVMRKKGWDLVGKLKAFGPKPARDLATGVIVLDEDEYVLLGLFQLAERPKPMPLEVPTGLIRRDPEHTITLHEAKKAL